MNLTPKCVTYAESTGFTDVGPKVLVSYYYHSYGAYQWGKTAKALPTKGEGWPSVLRAYKTPIFAKG